jgi:hypothetical protein
VGDQLDGQVCAGHAVQRLVDGVQQLGVALAPSGTGMIGAMVRPTG